MSLMRATATFHLNRLGAQFIRHSLCLFATPLPLELLLAVGADAPPRPCPRGRCPASSSFALPRSTLPHPSSLPRQRRRRASRYSTLPLPSSSILFPHPFP